MRKPEKTDDWDPYWDAEPSLVGTVTPLSEPKNPRKKPVMQRPIGYLANIDEEVSAE